jgi:hypothetical protein
VLRDIRYYDMDLMKSLTEVFSGNVGIFEEANNVRLHFRNDVSIGSHNPDAISVGAVPLILRSRLMGAVPLTLPKFNRL